ncbi:MAG: M1 family aminopeptidase [Owenweeksia sp.]|nr:M1 family aminopeptidase [Owenweeksia sp.]
MSCAHHWWGNLVTCQTDADMWINEGMAEYCSHLYLEDLIGRQRYLNEVRKNAYFVLEEAHVRDHGYRAIRGL